MNATSLSPAAARGPSPGAAFLPAISRLFVVDDEPDFLTTTRAEIGRMAPTLIVDTFDQPQQALAALRSSQPDALVTKLRMPGLSGIDLAWWARHVAPELPVVIASADGTNELRQTIEALRGTTFLEKPFCASRLFEAIESAASRAWAQPDFSGNVRLRTTADLVQLFALERSTGRLSIEHHGSSGDLWFENGEIVHARSPVGEGEPAVCEMLQWKGGAFSFTEAERTPCITIEASWEQLLLEACREEDESKGLVGDAFGAGAEIPSRELAKAVTAQTNGHIPASNVRQALRDLSQVSGYLGACLVDSKTGLMLGYDGGGTLNLEVAAAGNSEVVRAKCKAMAALGLNDAIEDVLVTLGKHYHLIRPLAHTDGLFVYLVLDKAKSNLAIGRHELSNLERQLALAQGGPRPMRRSGT